jgi:hypothetical protein
MEQPYIFDGIIYTSDNTSSLPPITVNINNKRTRTPSPILKVNKRNKLISNININTKVFNPLKINVSNTIISNTIKSKKNIQESFQLLSLSKKIKTN